MVKRNQCWLSEEEATSCIKVRHFVDASNHTNLLPPRTLWLCNNCTLIPPFYNKLGSQIMSQVYIVIFGQLKSGTWTLLSCVKFKHFVQSSFHCNLPSVPLLHCKNVKLLPVLELNVPVNINYWNDCKLTEYEHWRQGCKLYCHVFRFSGTKCNCSVYRKTDVTNLLKRASYIAYILHLVNSCTNPLPALDTTEIFPSSRFWLDPMHSHPWLPVQPLTLIIISLPCIVILSD